MLNDTLANALSLIYNAEKIGKTECIIKPSSKVIKKIFEIMKEKQYIGDYQIIESRQGESIKLNLINKINKCGVIKPRYPLKNEDYEKFEKRYLPAKNFGMLIISTSQGIMTQDEAKEKKIGGKLIAFIY